MENEFMAYMMQQPEDRVEKYFTGNISERFLRYKGDPKLDEYIQSTKASEFVRAAQELNSYVFGRWGIAGGRIGLYFFN
jgi:Iap family predicted aminopeptidase